VTISLFLLAIGAAVLAVGAEGAVKGAGRVAEARRVSPFVLGAVLFGIDLESLGATLTAAGRGHTQLAVGTAFGTVAFLVGLAFAAGLLLARGPVPSPSIGMVLLPSAPLVAAALAMNDRSVGRLEGAALVSLYVAYVGLVLWDGRPIEARGEEIVKEAEEGPRLPPLVLLVGGLAMVVVGADVLVEGATRLLDRTGLAAGFVGAAVLGSLAGLDEVLLEVVPIRRGLPELATGNLFGTVAAFPSGVVGLAALVRPLHVDGAGITAFLAASVLYTMAATVFLARGRAGKVLGAALLIVYAAWLAYAWQL
jgi:cation:H+ antiporter